MSAVAAFDPEAYDRIAAATVPGYDALQELVALAAATGLGDTPRVLDIGCGTGSGLVPLARLLPGAEIVACDPSAAMVEATRTRCKAEGIESCVVEGSVHAIASEPPFDVVVSTLVLHFIPKAARVDWLRAVRALIRPGGALVLTAITDSEAPGVAPHWASLRKDYAVRRGMSPEALARRKAPTASQVEEVREDELGAQLAEAGFAPAIPLYQLLAVRSWRVTAPCA